MKRPILMMSIRARRTLKANPRALEIIILPVLRETVEASRFARPAQLAR